MKLRWQDIVLIMNMALIAVMFIVFYQYIEADKPTNAPIAAPNQEKQFEEVLAAVESLKAEAQQQKERSDRSAAQYSEVIADEMPANPADDMAGDSVGAVFSSDTADASLNESKAKFEGLFVNYQYLKKCAGISTEAYHLLNSALMHELSSKSAPARMQYDIITAAAGTYQEIYARSECDEVAVEEVRRQFDEYLAGVKLVSFMD